MNGQGDIVLVTGAGRGIGRAIALRFAEQGAMVALVARTAGQLESAARDVRGHGGTALPIVADVGDPAAAADAVGRTVAEFGGLDVLVNNAGAAIMAPIERLTIEDWRTMVRVNLDAVFYMMKSAWPVLRRRGGGTIVNISSMAAFDPFPSFGAYGAAKAAVNLLSRSLADEGAKDNIGVFAVCPGTVDTEMFRSLGVDLPPESLMSPTEVADFVLWLCDHRGRPLSGQSLIVRKRP